MDKKSSILFIATMDIKKRIPRKLKKRLKQKSKRGYTLKEIFACGYWYVPYIPMKIISQGRVVGQLASLINWSVS